MRCPKCGYISFDHLATCLNCSKDFSDLSSTTRGTTYSAAPPLFLKFSQSTEPMEDDFESEPMQDEDTLDLVDPDLNILIEEEEGGIDFDPDLSLKSEFGSWKDEAPLSLDKEERDLESGNNELEVDLSQFEETPLRDHDGAEEEKFTIDLPDELADISDLAPPALSQKPTPVAGQRGDHEADTDFDIAQMDLKLDGLDMDFSLTSPDQDGKEDVLAPLSLNDIDASGSREEQKPSPLPTSKLSPVVKAPEMDMDADLDFELDLGGLTLPRK